MSNARELNGLFDIRNSTWVEVDLAAIRYNIQNILRSSRTPALVVVKSNAYGHGAVAVSEAAVSGGARMLGVTSVGEALQLRDGGISAPLLIMAPVRTSDMPLLLETKSSVVAWREEELHNLSAAAASAGRKIPIHIKVDIGMGRFGANPASAPAAVALAASLPGLVVEGLTGHLSSSDVEDPAITLEQIGRFRKVVEILEERKLRPPIVHCANSAAAFRYPEASYDMVRAGISVYGVNPSSTYPAPFELKPGFTWKAGVMNIARHEAGDLIGYGGEYRCPERQIIATIGVGYADGLRRVPKNVNQVLIGGERLRVVGRLCMQQCMVAVPGSLAQRIQLDDEVVLLGKQGGEEITATELANRWGTNEWDVFCGINSSIRRTYAHRVAPEPAHPIEVG